MQDNNGDDIWEAVMTFDFNSNVEYFISATANSGKQQVRPYYSPEGFYSFKYDYCEEQPLLPCTLSNGEIVESGWFGNDTGLNYCNTCSCEDGALFCSYLPCDPCGASQILAHVLLQFLHIIFNQESGNCEEFTWEVGEGTVPFETLELCENSGDKFFNRSKFK